MTFYYPMKVKLFLPFLLAMCMNNGISLAEEESVSTTTVAPKVKRCYKCETNCENGLGQIEDCQPDAEFFTYSCYTNIVNGKPFQRGCTLDYTEGEDCVTTEKGSTFCFCRTDACNSNLGSSPITPAGALTILSVLIGGNLMNYAIRA